jgi:hypothetical protein
MVGVLSALASSRCAWHARHVQRQHPTQRGLFTRSHQTAVGDFLRTRPRMYAIQREAASICGLVRRNGGARREAPANRRGHERARAFLQREERLRSLRSIARSARCVTRSAPFFVVARRGKRLSPLQERTYTFVPYAMHTLQSVWGEGNERVRSFPAPGVWGSSPAHDSRRSQPGRKAVSPRGQY